MVILLILTNTVSSFCTFKRRLEDRCRFEGEKQLLGVLAESPALLRGHNELANEARPITDVVVLVVLGQVENILRQQFGLRGAGGAHGESRKTAATT